VWFFTNFLFGAASGPLGITDATIAWEAHVGGFLLGLLAFRWFDRAEPGIFPPDSRSPQEAGPQKAGRA
jgi:membrane associated rhomboid family serine protease